MKNKKTLIGIIVLVLIAALAVCCLTIFNKPAETPVETPAAETALKIAVPNDATNEGRALLLLQANGVLKLDEAAGITATVKDIVENPLNIEFVEVEAAMVPNVLADVDYAIINGNYALAAELKDALLYENAESPYVNVVSVNIEFVEVEAATVHTAD